MLETLDELADYVADQMGVYGAHDDENSNVEPELCCRSCFLSYITQRMRDALENEGIIIAGRAAMAAGGTRP